MASVEEIRTRLENIQTVEPIVGALRTVSLGSWTAGLNRRVALVRYAEQLQEILELLIPHVAPRVARARFTPPFSRKTQPAPPVRQVVVLAVGTERGLCGRFNTDVANRVAALREAFVAREIKVRLVVLGAKLLGRLDRIPLPAAKSLPLPTSALPSFGLAFSLTREWLVDFEQYHVDQVHVIHNAYRSADRYETVVVPLIPPERPSAEAAVVTPPVVETDPQALYLRIVEQWTAIRAYACLLDSATAEHATRYRLMEGATQNAQRLIEDLTLELQSLRREAITREMQELAAGAGLLS